MGCDYREELGSARFVLTHALSAMCWHTLTTPWVSSNIPEGGILKDKDPSGEEWTGLTKPALSISALFMRLTQLAEDAKSCSPCHQSQ